MGVRHDGALSNDTAPAGAEGGVRSKRVTGVEPATFSSVTSSEENGSKAAKSAFPCRSEVSTVASVAM